MTLILQKDVKNLGKVGDQVRVKPGYGRNYLLPQGLAAISSKAKVKEFEHLKRVSDFRKTEAMKVREVLLSKLAGINLQYSVQAGEDEKLYGSITPNDIVKTLEAEHKISVDKKDIVLDEPIKILGQHKVLVDLKDGLSTEISISVERIITKNMIAETEAKPPVVKAVEETEVVEEA